MSQKFLLPTGVVYIPDFLLYVSALVIIRVVSLFSLVRLGCLGALYYWCMLVILSAILCDFNRDYIMHYSGALCSGRAHKCDILVVKKKKL